MKIWDNEHYFATAPSFKEPARKTVKVWSNMPVSTERKKAITERSKIVNQRSYEVYLNGTDPAIEASSSLGQEAQALVSSSAIGAATAARLPSVSLFLFSLSLSLSNCLC